jgi:hypothetical protein
MRVVVNKFLNQVEGQVDKLKGKVDRDTMKKAINVGKQVVEKIPKKDQLIKRFASPICTIKIQNQTEQAYNRIKGTMDKMGSMVGTLRKAIDAIDRQINNVLGFADKVRKILSMINKIVSTLKTVVKVISQAIMSIPAQFVTAGVIIKLGDIMKVSSGMIATFEAMIEIVPNTLDYYEERIKAVHKSITPIRERVHKTDNYIIYHRQVLESVYLKYINVCNVPDQESTDNDGIVNEDALQVGEEQQDAVNDFLSADPTPENTLEAQDELAAYYTETVESLQAKGETEAIERLYRAEFSEIPYDRKRSYEKLDISTG